MELERLAGVWKQLGTQAEGLRAMKLESEEKKFDLCFGTASGRGILGWGGRAGAGLRGGRTEHPSFGGGALRWGWSLPSSPVSGYKHVTCACVKAGA